MTPSSMAVGGGGNDNRLVVAEVHRWSRGRGRGARGRQHSIESVRRETTRLVSERGRGCSCRAELPSPEASDTALDRPRCATPVPHRSASWRWTGARSSKAAVTVSRLATTCSPVRRRLWGRRWRLPVGAAPGASAPGWTAFHFGPLEAQSSSRRWTVSRPWSPSTSKTRLLVKTSALHLRTSLFVAPCLSE